MWSGDYKPAKIRITRATEVGRSGSDTGYGVISGSTVDSAPDVDTSLGGFGFAGAISYSGMSRAGNDCNTYYFNPGYDSKGTASDDFHWHTLTSCYEKWHRSGSTTWVYNRWGVFTRATPRYRDLTLTGAYIKDFSIRTRQWKGYESRFANLNDWAPRAGGSTCTDVANTTFSWGGASIQFPVHKCENLTMVGISKKTSPVRFEIGSVWTGKTEQQRYGDVAGNFAASNATTTLVFADYSWMEVCAYDFLGCPGSTYLKQADSGW